MSVAGKGIRETANDVFRKKDIILNALIERKGLQYLTDMVSETMNNPFFVYDISGKILSLSQDTQSCEVWKELLPEGYLDSENMRIAEQAGLIEKIMSGDTPVLGVVPYSPFRLLGCRIRDKDGAIGIATIVEKNPLQEADPELLVIVCKAILFEMLYRERTAMQNIPYFNLFKDIIEDTAAKNEIKERCQVLHLKFPRTMRLLGIKFSDVHRNSLSLNFLRETLLTVMPPCYCIIYDESLILILADKYLNKSLLDTVRKTFPNDEIRIGVSRIFTGILNMKGAFEEMKAIQSVYQKLNLEKPLTYYEDVLLYHFMEIASKETDLKMFCSPILYQLARYDEENKTLFGQSIEAYLEASRNMQRAAQKLHIHKNTLYYRLKRAEELFDLDLNDENLCFTLQFSFRMQRMIK